MQKTAIITGASSGIGAATAATFLGNGFVVINIARRPSPVEGVINIAADLGSDDGAEEAAAVAPSARSVLAHTAEAMES